MKVLCLGGAGRICREAAFDLVNFSEFERITIADYDLKAAKETAIWLSDKRVDYVKIDINNEDESISILKKYDVVVDGTTISLNNKSTKSIAQANCHGINLNGFGEEYKYSEIFKNNNRIFIPGFGMTPGLTNMMAKYACDMLYTVDSVRISHGAFRPIAFSKAITETTIYEYNPQLESRFVFENGKFIQVPPFARPREIELPYPFGTHIQYIIPHAETRTLAEYLKNKGVNLIEVRGTWPQENMELIKQLYKWNFLKNEQLNINGIDIGIMDVIGSFLQKSEKAQKTDLYGYALHVEVEGSNYDNNKVNYVLTHTHPLSDGTVKGWENIRAYTRNVAIPMSIGAQLIASKKYKGRGVLIPEYVFDPKDVFEELKKRDIFLHEKKTMISQI